MNTSKWRLLIIAPLCFAMTSLFAIFGLSGGIGAAFAQSEIESRLAPARTTSPRATLLSFIETMENAYDAGKSGQSRESVALLDQAVLYLDLSELPARPAYYLRVEAALKLKEVLDRVELPPRDAIPDRLQALGQSRETGIILGGGGSDDPIRLWEIPGTDVRIHLIKEGPRTGEYLFTPRTIKQIDFWFTATRDLPYKRTSTPNIYDAYALTPGLGIAPLRHGAMPAWLLTERGGQALWQWAALFGTIIVVVLLVWGLMSFARRLEKTASPNAHRLAAPTLISVGLSAWLFSFADFLIDRVFNVTGDLLLFVGGAFTIASYGFTAWFGWKFALFVVNAYMQIRRIDPSSAQAQLSRLLGMAIGAAIVLAQTVFLAEAFGLPAVSIIAGFGVGGLAVSLAARETLSDLLGSIVVLIERPYKVGDFISVGNDEGTVEHIGFRSTRIRTISSFIVSIPNSALAGGKVSNYGLRKYRMSENTLRISDRTPVEKLESFLQSIRELLQRHPEVRQDTTLVNLKALAPGSFDILIRYYLDLEDYAGFLSKTEEVLLEIVRTASEAGVELAPTQTIATSSAEKLLSD